MRTKSLQRMAAVLLCVFLCLGTAFFTMGTASAAELEDTDGTAELNEPPVDTQPPIFGVSVELTPPEGWVQTSANVALCVTDGTGGGFASVEVRTGEDEIWLDITDSLEQTGNGYRGTMQVTENGTFFARVTGLNGEVTEKSCAVECFDTTAPDLQASIVEDTLHLEAADDLSGVAQITVGGASFEYGTAEIPLDELGTSELIPIQVVDRAGNRSQVVMVVNPRTHGANCPCSQGGKSDDTQPAPSPEPSPSQPPVQTQKPAESTPSPSAPVKTPATTTPTTTAPAETQAPSASNSTTQPPDDEQASKPLTPDGQGTVVDDATDQDGKEFFTFTTPDENTFYLVIDRQRDSENVYFLNAVTESDLRALAEKDKEPEPSVSAIPEPEPEPVCTCTDKCAVGAINTDCPVCAVSMKDCTGTAPAIDPEPEPEKPEKDGSGGAMILLLIAALATGGVGYYLKVWKPKHDLDDAEDFDELTGEEEETVNEDDQEPAPRYGPSDEPEEPDFQSGYGPEEDE